MTPKFSDETAISNCAICVLATAMRDCPRCAFNAGLIVKALKQNDRELFRVKLPPTKMSVSMNSLWGRLSTNLDNYREHFNKFCGEVEITR